MASSDSFFSGLIGVHDILDQDGTTMPRRHTLQFVNAIYEDDPANERGKITLALQPVFITPAAIGTQQDDLAPTGIETCTDIAIQASTASWSLTGIESTGLVVYEKRLWNKNTVASGYAITFKNGDASSTAGNRFICPGGIDYVLQPSYAVKLIWDSTVPNWRVFPCLA